MSVNLFQQHPELGEVWFRSSQTMMLISHVDGSIYDANQEFCEWIGYTNYEFQRPINPVTWHELTLPDKDLETDKVLAQRLFDGEFLSYSVRKHYIPKAAGLPRFVETHVIRYPYSKEEEFICCLVEVTPLEDASQQVIKEMTILQQKTALSIEEISKSIESMRNYSLQGILDYLSERPSIGIPILLLFTFLLFGRSIVEIFQLASNLIN